MWSSSVITPHAAAHQAVLHRADRPLVAGDHAAAEDHRVALAQRDVAGACRRRCAASALRGSPWLPVTRISRLSSGTSSAASSGTNGGDALAGSRTRAPPPRGCAACGRPARRCARRRAPPARCSRPGRRCWRSRSPRPGRAGRRSARAERAAHLGLGAGMPLDHGVGAVADHRQHALVAERGERGLVGRRADQRVRVELPVAGVQDDAVPACGSPAPAPPGIECATRRNCSENGASSNAPPGGMTCSFTSSSSCASPSLRRSTAAANGVA